MTKEQIAEFREMAANEEGLLDLCFAIRPLLDEREVLLKALEELAYRASDPDVFRDAGVMVKLAFAVRGAKAAIEKAEEPYEPPPPTVFVSSRPGSE